MTNNNSVLNTFRTRTNPYSQTCYVDPRTLSSFTLQRIVTRGMVHVLTVLNGLYYGRRYGWWDVRLTTSMILHLSSLWQWRKHISMCTYFLFLYAIKHLALGFAKKATSLPTGKEGEYKKNTTESRILLSVMCVFSIELTPFTALRKGASQIPNWFVQG